MQFNWYIITLLSSTNESHSLVVQADSLLHELKFHDVMDNLVTPFLYFLSYVASGELCSLKITL